MLRHNILKVHVVIVVEELSEYISISEDYARPLGEQALLLVVVEHIDFWALD